jgi:hypothetical protein
LDRERGFNTHNSTDRGLNTTIPLNTINYN